MACSRVFIALGSNVGDSGLTLMQALKALDEAAGVSVRRISQFLRTEPVGGPPDQPPYLNGVAELEVESSPHELLAVLQGIERSLGRDRAREVRWGPRTCDLDILLVGDAVIDSPDLTVPHPRMHERLFVLEPLAGLAANVVHPGLGKTVGELLAAAKAAGRIVSPAQEHGARAGNGGGGDGSDSETRPENGLAGNDGLAVAGGPGPRGRAKRQAAPRERGRRKRAAGPGSGAPPPGGAGPRVSGAPTPRVGGALVSVIGLPASGKTTLAELLAVELPAELIREDYEGNPFLADSYIGPRQARLPAQLFYLLSRVRQLSAVAWPGEGVFVSDYGFCQDHLYASQRLSAEDLAAYEPIHARLVALVHPPDVLVHLDAAPAALLERIALRGRHFERAMTEDFLSAMRNAYNALVREMTCPVLTIRCDEVDLRRPAERADLVERIRDLL
jgi:2-amino-4-hydroxy-6-hydroxymethyldihydropteridine diphosphokinase